MKVLVRNHGEGGTSVEVIDPSDGAVTHQANIDPDQQVTVVATSAHSPADIEFGEVEAIPVADPEPDPEAETPDGEGGEAEGEGNDSPDGTEAPDGDGEQQAA